MKLKREEVIPDNFLSKTNRGPTHDDGSDGWLLSSSLPDEEEEEVEALNTACVHTHQYIYWYPGARDFKYPPDELWKDSIIMAFYLKMRNHVSIWI